MFRIRKFDFYLFFPAILLLGLGVIIIASVSPDNLINHLIYLFLAFAFFFLFSFFDLEILFPLSPFLYLSCLFFLTLPFFVGTITRGSIRWIPIGQFTIQPSEIVKPFLALVSAWFWARREFSFKNLFIFFLLFLPVLILIFLQPDLGSTLIVLSIFVGTVLALPIKTKQLLTLLAIIFLGLPLFWFTLKDYQKLRVRHFLNPYEDPLGKGYNIIQAKIAIGSGGIFGRGLGHGTQSHLAFLPERSTDFVFASLSEELGLVGSLAVLLLFFFLLARILNIAFKLRDNFSNGKMLFLLSMGLFFYLALQIVVNIGMNIGLLPITGVTLPLISYGGSSLLTTMITLGMLENIFKNSRENDFVEIK